MEMVWEELTTADSGRRCAETLCSPHTGLAKPARTVPVLLIGLKDNANSYTASL